MDRNSGLRHRKVAGNRLRTGRRPVDDANLGNTDIGKRPNNGPGRTPAPSMTAGPAVGSQLGTPSPRFARNPKASVLRPSRLPSGPTTIVFTAPIRRARGSM